MVLLGLAATTLMVSSSTYNRASLCFQLTSLNSVRNWHGQEQPRSRQSLAPADAQTKGMILELKASSSSELAQEREDEERAGDDGRRVSFDTSKKSRWNRQRDVGTTTPEGGRNSRAESSSTTTTLSGVSPVNRRRPRGAAEQRPPAAFRIPPGRGNTNGAVEVEGEGGFSSTPPELISRRPLRGQQTPLRWDSPRDRHEDEEPIQRGIDIKTISHGGGRIPRQRRNWSRVSVSSLSSLLSHSRSSPSLHDAPGEPCRSEALPDGSDSLPAAADQLYVTRGLIGRTSGIIGSGSVSGSVMSLSSSDDDGDDVRLETGSSSAIAGSGVGGSSIAESRVRRPDDKQVVDPGCGGRAWADLSSGEGSSVSSHVDEQEEPSIAKDGAPGSWSRAIPEQTADDYADLSRVEESYERGRWLLGLLVLQSTSSFVLDHYQTLLREHVVVTLFLTMLVGAGGNAGNQSAIKVIRGLATGRFTADTACALRVIGEQATVGLLLGTALSMGGFARVMLTAGTTVRDAAAISMSLFLIVMTSVLLGSALPFGFARTGVDPAHAGTSIQVAMDIVGVAVTCVTCSVVLGQLDQALSIVTP